MNILYICSEYPLCTAHGGIGTFTKILAEAMVQRGHKVFVAGISEDIKKDSIIEKAGVTVLLLKKSGIVLRYDLLDRVRFSVFVRKIVRKYRIDIIESPDYWGHTALWMRLNKPVVIRMHGSATFLAAEMSTSVPRSLRYFEKSSLKRADAFIGVSRYIFKRTSGLFSLPNKPTFLLHNPIDTVTANLPKKSNLVVFTGTLMRLKGVYSLIEAWERVVSAVPNARLHCYGKNTFEDGVSVLESLRKKLKQNVHTVEFHGHVAREVLLKKLAVAEIAVFPSYTESFGLAPLEAMAYSCSTIFTKRASGPEIINHGVDGLLIDPSNPKEIADAIIYLLQNKGQSRKIAAAGVEKVKRKFSYQKIIAENEKVYKRIVDLYAIDK